MNLKLVKESEESTCSHYLWYMEQNSVHQESHVGLVLHYCLHPLNANVQDGTGNYCQMLLSQMQTLAILDAAQEKGSSLVGSGFELSQN